MLFIIVTLLKAHKVKVQAIEQKVFSLSQKGSTLYTMTECHCRNKNNKRNNKRNYRMNPKSYFLALGGSSFWLGLEGGTSLALGSISLFLASVSCVLALVVSLASAGGLVSLSFPLSFAPSTLWLWSPAWLGPFRASGRVRVA